MVQAARPVKQNLAEGMTDGQTSFEVEIKLLGIAKGSNQELCEDYQDYLKHHKLGDWSKGQGQPGCSSGSVRYGRLLEYCRSHNDLVDYEPYFYRWTDEEMCNTAITLCHMIDKMLTSFIARRDREFVEEGGIRERMTVARLDRRGTQKEIIARLERENAELREKVRVLEREMEKLKGAR